MKRSDIMVWWARLEHVVQITGKVVSLLKIADSAVPNPADFYLGIKDLNNHIKGLREIEGFLMEEDLQTIEKYFLKRKTNQTMCSLGQHII